MPARIGTAKRKMKVIPIEIEVEEIEEQESVAGKKVWNDPCIFCPNDVRNGGDGACSCILPALVNPNS